MNLENVTDEPSPTPYPSIPSSNNLVESKTIKIRRPGSGEPISTSPLKKIIRPRNSEPVSTGPVKKIRRSKSDQIRKLAQLGGGQSVSTSLVKRQPTKHRSETKDISSILEYLNVEEDDYLNKILLRKNINGLIIHVDELCKENANNPIKESELKSLSFVLNKVRKNMGLSADDVLVMFQKHIPYKVYESLKRLVKEDKKQYKALVRTFSLSIHFYSPLAYNFLRQRLGDGLPHPRTIQSWYTTIDKYMH